MQITPERAIIAFLVAVVMFMFCWIWKLTLDIVVIKTCLEDHGWHLVR